MTIRFAESDADIAACHAVMKALRPRLDAADFSARVRRLQAGGYRLAFMRVEGEVVAVTGFHILENLAWERFLYVDDLVTHPGHRSCGHGATMLGWLRAEAVREGCHQLHLDSGTQRKDAHRFYEREGMTMTCLHFQEPVAAGRGDAR